eukprot:4751851-Pyramimonas_sp.AAC.1
MKLIPMVLICRARDSTLSPGSLQDNVSPPSPTTKPKYLPCFASLKTETSSPCSAKRLMALAGSIPCGSKMTVLPGWIHSPESVLNQLMM